MKNPCIADGPERQWRRDLVWCNILLTFWSLNKKNLLKLNHVTKASLSHWLQELTSLEWSTILDFSQQQFFILLTGLHSLHFSHVVSSPKSHIILCKPLLKSLLKNRMKIYSLLTCEIKMSWCLNLTNLFWNTFVISWDKLQSQISKSIFQFVSLFSSTYLDKAEAINYTTTAPIGVAGLISPWNLPLYLLTFKIAPCIAFGNTCVCKPSEMTSVTAWMLSKAVVQAG